MSNAKSKKYSPSEVLPFMPADHPNAGLYNEKQAAIFLEVPIEIFKMWRARGGGPRYVKIGRAVRYQQHTLLAFKEDGFLARLLSEIRPASICA